MPEYERDGRAASSDAAPLLDSFPRLSTSPINAPLTSSTSSTSGTYKQLALMFLAVCVVGYLFIVFLEISPLVYSHRVLSRLYQSSDASHDCHLHTHSSVDDPFTVDERIDHLLYRSLKLAIDRGDDTQAATIAKALAAAAKAKSQLPPPPTETKTAEALTTSHSTTSKPKGKRKWPPTAEEVSAVKGQVDALTAEEVQKRDEKQWAKEYSQELRFEGYLHKPLTHLGAGYQLSAEGCINLDGQCSAPGRAAAVELCNRIESCRGFACNNERKDCQLRVAPLVHDATRPQFDAYYKTATDLASADVRISVKRRAGAVADGPGAPSQPLTSTGVPSARPPSSASSPTASTATARSMWRARMENVKLAAHHVPRLGCRASTTTTAPCRMAMLEQLQEAGRRAGAAVDTANNERMKRQHRRHVLALPRGRGRRRAALHRAGQRQPPEPARGSRGEGVDRERLLGAHHQGPPQPRPRPERRPVGRGARSGEGCAEV